MQGAALFFDGSIVADFHEEFKKEKGLKQEGKKGLRGNRRKDGEGKENEWLRKRKWAAKKEKGRHGP